MDKSFEGKVIVIKIYYHKNCFDGICSAWVAWRKFSKHADYIPINYGEPYESIIENCNRNDDIYFVDFSLPRNLMDLLYSKVNKLVVLDHHKTAETSLKDASYAIFDMNESGASLAWKWFFPDLDIPFLVRYIKDRDLWLFKENESRAINAYIQSYEMNIEIYNYLYLRLENDIKDARIIGHGILRYMDKLVKDMCNTFIMKDIGGYSVPVVNASILFSEVGNELCKRNLGLFSAYYFDRNDGKRQWGLRSIGDFDVSEVAKKYGGGGHKNSAGFIATVAQLAEATDLKSE